MKTIEHCKLWMKIEIGWCCNLKQLGHHSIKITVDTYYHWIPGTSNTEVNDLDQNAAPIRTLSAPSHGSTNEKGVANLANPL